MAIYLLETIDWYFGLRQNDSAGGGTGRGLLDLAFLK